MKGRQIKNVVKSASLLAMSERGPLKASHVRTVLRIKAVHGAGVGGYHDGGKVAVADRKRS